MKMRTMLILTLLSVGLLLAVTGIAGADVTKSVPASATVTGVSTLSVTPMNYTGGGAGSIAFGTVSPGGDPFQTPPQYIKVDHNDNSMAWWIKIHTNNFDVNLATYDPGNYAVGPATATWGFQYGGMIGTPGARLPMGWHARKDNSLTSASASTAGDPISDPAWYFLKDYADRNDPSPQAPDDESWLGPKGDAAYANVAFGSASYQNVIDPTDPEQKNGSVEDADKTFVVEVEGIFGVAPADTYGTTIYFDLVHL